METGISAVSRFDDPTLVMDGTEMSPTLYPDGIAARMLMISFSRLSIEALLLMYATAAVIRRLTSSLIVDWPIRFGDK